MVTSKNFKVFVLEIVSLPVNSYAIKCIICNTPFLLRVLILGPLDFSLKVDLKVTVCYKITVRSSAFKVMHYFQSVTSNDLLHTFCLPW